MFHSRGFGRTHAGAVLGIVKKLSPGFIESGMKYIDSSVNKAHVIRICVSEMTGKATR